MLKFYEACQLITTNVVTALTMHAINHMSHYNSFHTINIFDQGKTLCLPCIIKFEAEEKIYIYNIFVNIYCERIWRNKKRTLNQLSTYVDHNRNYISKSIRERIIHTFGLIQEIKKSVEDEMLTRSKILFFNSKYLMKRMTTALVKMLIFNVLSR